ncbi:MAG: flagellar M-ring protein FliF C-terminal domain-containing protein [Planctomycetota bacterium]
MRAFLNDFYVNLRGIWTRLDGGQRLVVTSVMLAAMVGLGALLWFAGQPSYVIALESTSGEELRDARRLLGQAGVTMVADDSGRGILVERSELGKARSVLIEGGLLDRNSRSFLDGSIVEDAETKRFKLDAAARGQTEAAIAALDGVRGVTVTASRPTRSPFLDRDAASQPRATIALRLAAGASFDGVAHSAASLASSQLGVPMSNVEVVNAGNPRQRWRWDPDRESGGGSSEFLALQRRMAEERTMLAQEALEAIHPGKTLVTVGVELDPTWETTMQKVLPPEPLVVSDSSMKDTTENTERTGNGGDPSIGAAANERPATTNTSKKETRDRQFVTDIGERKTGRLAPEIRRMSVALLYDRSLEDQPGFDRESLVRVVKSIVGWDPARDQDSAFSSMSGEFAEQPPLELSGGPGIVDVALQWAPAAGQVLGVLLVLMFLKSLLKSPVTRAATGGAAAAAVGAGAAGGPAAPAEEDLPPEEQQRRMRREIERAIAGDPAALAKMLESWLAEQRA